MGGASCVTIIIEKVIPARSDICPCFKLTKSQEKNKEYILKLAKQIQFLCEISVANYFATSVKNKAMCGQAIDCQRISVSTNKLELTKSIYIHSTHKIADLLTVIIFRIAVIMGRKPFFK